MEGGHDTPNQGDLGHVMNKEKVDNVGAHDGGSMTDNQGQDAQQENDNGKHKIMNDQNEENKKSQDNIRSVKEDPGNENPVDQIVNSQPQQEPALSEQMNLNNLKENLKDGKVEVKSKKKNKKKKKKSGKKKKKSKKDSQLEYEDEDNYDDDYYDEYDGDDGEQGGYDKHSDYYDDEVKGAMGPEGYGDNEDENAPPTEEVPEEPTNPPFDEEKVQEIHEEVSEEIKEMGKV